MVAAARSTLDFAVIETLESIDVSEKGEPILLPLDTIQEDPNQPRTEFNEEEISELAHTITLYGLLSPILVYHDADGIYTILHGARRYRAFRLLGKKEIPCIITKKPEENAKVYMQIVENTARSDLTHIEMAEFVMEQSKKGKTNKEIAEAIGKNNATITHYKKFGEAPAWIRDLAITGKCDDILGLYELTLLYGKYGNAMKRHLSKYETITRKDIRNIAHALPLQEEEKKRQSSKEKKSLVQPKKRIKRPTFDHEITIQGEKAVIPSTLPVYFPQSDSIRNFSLNELVTYFSGKEQ